MTSKTLNYARAVRFLISSATSKQCKSLITRELNGTVRACGCGDQCKYLCRRDNFSNFLLGAAAAGCAEWARERERALFCFAIGARIIPLTLFTYKGNNTCTFHGAVCRCLYMCAIYILLAASYTCIRARCMHTYLLVCAAAAAGGLWSRRQSWVERSFSEQAVAVLIPARERSCVHLVITFSWFKLIDLHTLCRRINSKHSQTAPPPPLHCGGERRGCKVGCERAWVTTTMKVHTLCRLRSSSRCVAAAKHYAPLHWRQSDSSHRANLSLCINMMYDGPTLT